MELLFVAVLMLVMAGALAAGFPVAFALPGSAILTIGLAALSGYVVLGDVSAFFYQGGPVEWLSAGVTNFRGVYWEVERDTLIAIPLFVFMGIMLQRSRIAEDLLVTMAQLFGPVPGGLGISVVLVGGPSRGDNRNCRSHGSGDGADLSTGHAPQQLFEAPCYGHDLRLRHARADHPAVDRADHSCRSAFECDGPGFDPSQGRVQARHWRDHAPVLL